MRKYLILILVLFMSCGRILALEIVYPKKTPCSIIASSTFFIGSVNPGETLKINSLDVKVSPLGAFAQVVPLYIGTNNFKITSTLNGVTSVTNDGKANVSAIYNTINFVIERPKLLATCQIPPVLIEYPILNNFYVANDNAPLRVTPIDCGINRMSHLPKDTQLMINGEKGNFYRVYLNPKLNGWMSKSNVEQRDAEKNANLSVKINSFKIKDDDEEFTSYEFDLGGKLTPFILKESNGLNLQLFNIDGQPSNTFSLNIPMKKLFGYDIINNDGKFILKVRNNPPIDTGRPLNGIKIAVDAGHGGSEIGAIGCCGDKEKDINLAIAKNLQQELLARGAKIVMTRENDVDTSLADRVKIAKDNDSVLLISIHANALPDGGDPIKNRGTSVYYYQNQAKPLADSILSSMTAELGTQNDKVRQGSLALVRPTSSVSVLIEVAYMINPDDYGLLIDKNFQVNCAKAIADGIEDYLKK